MVTFSVAPFGGAVIWWLNDNNKKNNKRKWKLFTCISRFYFLNINLLFVISCGHIPDVPIITSHVCLLGLAKQVLNIYFEILCYTVDIINTPNSLRCGIDFFVDIEFLILGHSKSFRPSV